MTFDVFFFLLTAVDALKEFKIVKKWSFGRE